MTPLTEARLASIRSDIEDGEFGKRDDSEQYEAAELLLGEVDRLQAALRQANDVKQRFHDWRNASEDERAEDFFEHLVRLVRESDDEVNAARATTRAAEQSELKALRERDQLRREVETLADCVLDNCERPEGGAWYPNDSETVALARRIIDAADEVNRAR